jgi:hypothetical protein
MRSITFWNRLEPRPRAMNIAPALSARIRDPLWMLTRQWQFGEFHGEDAAAPAYVQMSATDGRLLGWQKDQQSFQAVRDGSPLEPMILREDFSPDLASRVEGRSRIELCAYAELQRVRRHRKIGLACQLGIVPTAEHNCEPIELRKIRRRREMWIQSTQRDDDSWWKTPFYARCHVTGERKTATFESYSFASIATRSRAKSIFPSTAPRGLRSSRACA